MQRLDIDGRLAFRPTEVAEGCGLSRTTVYEAIRTGELPSRRLGKRIVVPADALRAWLSGQSA